MEILSCESSDLRTDLSGIRLSLAPSCTALLSAGHVCHGYNLVLRHNSSRTLISDCLLLQEMWYLKRSQTQPSTFWQPRSWECSQKGVASMHLHVAVGSPMQMALRDVQQSARFVPENHKAALLAVMLA